MGVDLPCRTGSGRARLAGIGRHLVPVALLASLGVLPFGPAQADGPPLFDSTADTVFDIIREDDPSAYLCLSYQGRAVRQMWDKRQDAESDLNVFLFAAHFSDMPPVDVILNPEFGSPEAAEAEARKYVYRLGQVPLAFRHGVRQFGIHEGDEGFHAGAGKVFVYSAMADRRIAENHLEESLLHESVHATLDDRYRLAPEWVAAQREDGAFMTRYAAQSPEREDLAETALFAFALLRHPGRLPPVDGRAVMQAVPARIAVVDTILAAAPQVPAPPPPPQGCE